MSKDRKRPPGRNPFLDDDRDALLDDLDNIRTLLDEDKDGASSSSRPGPHDDIPVLLPDDEPDAPVANKPAAPGKATPASREGDTHTQTSLFDQKTPPAPPPANAESDRQRRLSNRDNPFLPRQSMEDLAAERQRLNRNDPQMPIEPPTQTHTGDHKPTPEQVRALIDEVLAEWMPKLEREMRDRLTEWFRENH